MPSINVLSYTQQINPDTFEPYLVVSLELYPFAYSNDQLSLNDIKKLIGVDIVEAILNAQRKWVTDEHTSRNSTKEENK